MPPISAAPISGPFDALIDDDITFNASIKKPKFRMPKKGWVLVCFQSNQTKEEVIFRKINMSQRYRLRIVEMYKNII